MTLDINILSELQSTHNNTEDIAQILVKELLQQVCRGNFSEANFLLEKLFRTRGRFHAYSILAEIVKGNISCNMEGPVYILDDYKLSTKMRENFTAAVEQCQDFFQIAAPTILLQCREELPGLHLTLVSFPGLATMRLSTLSEGFPDNLREVQFHEVAHCFLTCGVRFLDEGLAHFIASKFTGVTLDLISTDYSLLPDEKVLLSRAADAMFAFSSTSDMNVYHLACQLGTDLINDIYNKGGASAIVRLFSEINRSYTDAEIVEAVERESGRSFSATEKLIEIKNYNSDLIDLCRNAIFKGWESSLVSDFDNALREFENLDIFNNADLLDSLLNLKLNRALLIFNNKQQLSIQEIAEIDLLLKAAELLPPGRLWLWRGVRAVLAICIARPNIIKVAIAGQQAITAFKKSVEINPHDPDLLVQHATLLLNAPVNFGGDRDLGVSKLRLAMTYPGYNFHAEQILLKYNSLFSSADESLEKTCDFGKLQTLMPLVIAENMQVKISPSFTLGPMSFKIRQGERIGIVGRNGSGKTILIETLLGLRNINEGNLNITINNDNLDLRQEIGGLIQNADFPSQIKVAEIMDLHRNLYGRTDDSVTFSLGMNELKYSLWHKLSRGQKQRVMLWLALAHTPKIVVLDEPSLGLDEWFHRALRDILASLSITLIIISHAPADLLNVDRIIVLRGGQINCEGSLKALILKHVGKYKARILQTLTPEAEKEMLAMPNLLYLPTPLENGWEMYGVSGFENNFREFIKSHVVTSFSLEITSVEDFLSNVTKL